MLRRKPTRVELGSEDLKDLEQIELERGRTQQEDTTSRDRNVRIFGHQEAAKMAMDNLPDHSLDI
jgi:hypothetical protein